MRQPCVTDRASPPVLRAHHSFSSPAPLRHKEMEDSRRQRTIRAGGRQEENRAAAWRRAAHALQVLHLTGALRRRAGAGRRYSRTVFTRRMPNSLPAPPLPVAIFPALPEYARVAARRALMPFTRFCLPFERVVGVRQKYYLSEEKRATCHSNP